MKIVHEKDYDYLGSHGGWHMFSLKVAKFDEEILLVPRAKMIMRDGSCRYFDSTSPTLSYDSVARVLDGEPPICMVTNAEGKLLAAY